MSEDVIIENNNGFEPQNSAPYFVAGLGASAGGIQALQEFFRYVPSNSGIAYVVILHLSPDHDSQLSQILQDVAAIPVHQVTRNVTVKPDNIYVISPNNHLEMVDGEIRVSQNMLVEDRRAPVDIFFRTLAESHGYRAIAVVLSGTGANGSMGLKRVKEKGGAAFAQNPGEALFNDMPRNAIATELVDDVLPVGRIPAKIMAYTRSAGAVSIPLEVQDRGDEQQQALREIFTLLRVRTAHDFSNYKRPTLLRRIERRINVHNLPDLSAYAELMRDNEEETQALLKDLLISVTNFFRDKPAFEYIEHSVLPRIIQGKKSGEPLRIWIAGCATGEEAYSLAMLCVEQTTGMVDGPKIQIFASDIDDTAIMAAREGIYSLNDAADVSPGRLRRFFAKQGDSFRVRGEIREMILFANHNVLKDPPFSHIDLISCRNLLIYFNGSAQDRVMETFHFALNPGSFLFLGNSESVSGALDLFATVSNDLHVYQSRVVTNRGIPLGESSPKSRFGEPRQLERIQRETPQRSSERPSFGELHQRLLEEYAPPSLVINEAYDVVHVSERAGKFLQVSGGELSKNLIKMIRPEIRLEIRTAIYQASSRNISIKVENLKIPFDGLIETFNVHVRPVLGEEDTARGFLLVIFEPTGLMEVRQEKEESVRAEEAPLARQLEEELFGLRAQLRSSAEQYEVQAEELKASNEELQAINEELRSSAEELETSREELQSINEELRTVNQELKVKIEETTIANSNLQNLIFSTQIATIFLDKGFRVNLFTPAAKEIFNLIPADYGRPLSDITSKLIYSDLIPEAERVLEMLQTVEQEVETQDGRIWTMRISPYRTEEDRINGVVITLIDITRKVAAQEELRKSEERFRMLVSASSDTIFKLNPDWTKLTLTDPQSNQMDFVTSEVINLEKLVPDEEVPKMLAKRDAALGTQSMIELEHRRFAKDGSIRWTFSRAIPVFDTKGKLIEWFGAASDITEQKNAEESLRENELRFRTLTNAVPQIIWTNKADGTADYFNERWYEFTGFDHEPPTFREWQLPIHPDDMAEVTSLWRNSLQTGEIFSAEYRIRRFDNEYCWHIARNIPLKDQKGNISAWFGSATDVDALKMAKETIGRSKELMRVTVDSIADYAIISMDILGNIIAWNTGATSIFGYSETEVIGQHSSLIFTPEDNAVNAPDLEMRQARAAGRAADERWHLKKNGERVYMSGVLAPIYTDKAIIGYVKVARDMTEFKKAEELLRISEERYRIALQSAGMGAWDWNVEEESVMWNEQHYTMLGLDPVVTPQKSDYFLDFVHPADRRLVSMALSEAMENSDTYHSEFRVVLPDSGSVRWMNGYGKVVAKNNGRAVRMVGVMSDITTRKALEQQKEEFIGIASHELKTPVTSIKAYTDVLAEILSETDHSVQADIVAKLDAQVERMTALLRDLLDTTKLQEGQLELTLENFNVEDLIVKRLEDIRPISAEHEFTLNIKWHGNLVADRDRIGQVLTNLMINAVKYSPKGSEVIISCEKIGEYLKIGVSDHGDGIPDEYKGRIFERFFRFSTQKNSAQGMGLGLYISAGIIARHNGSLWVENTADKGSTFYFTLPLNN